MGKKIQLKDITLAVVIPIYNGEMYIGEMLDSIVKQTFQDWNLWVVDDESTDSTFSILLDYAKKDTRIKPVKRNRDPKGAQTCRNLGFELSEGAKYVIFFDADDTIAPYCFEQRVSYMESHPNLDFAVFPAKAFRTDPYDNSNRYFGVIKQKDDYLNFLYPWLSFVVWCNIYRRDSLVSHEMRWDERVLINQDSDYNIQAMHRGMKYDYCDDARVDYYYRTMVEGSVSKKKKQRSRFDSFLYLLDKYNSTFTIEEKKKYKNAITHRLLYFALDFSQDKDRFKTLLNHPFFGASWWVKCRLKLIAPYLKHGRLLDIFFPQVRNRYKSFVDTYTKESVSIAQTKI